MRGAQVSAAGGHCAAGVRRHPCGSGQAQGIAVILPPDSAICLQCTPVADLRLPVVFWLLLDSLLEHCLGNGSSYGCHHTGSFWSWSFGGHHEMCVGIG